MDDRPSILASDLDGTLIPTRSGSEHLEAIGTFAALMARRPDVTLAYVTGRRLERVEDAIRRYDLPIPDFVACDVGTRVYQRTEAGYVPDGVYDDAMTRALGGTTTRDLRALLSALDGLVLQPDVDQTEFKASFDFQQERHQEIEGVVRERLGDRRVSMVVSVDPYRGTGLLDILPDGVAKDTAIDHLRSAVGASDDDLYYAGDSGNDLRAMLRGYRVTVVGNADDTLVDTLRREGAERSLLHRLYFARAPFAAGVVEGCRHWGLLPSD